MNKDSHSLNWFEIPVLEIERAKKYYEQIFQVEMTVSTMDDTEMAFFPWKPGSGKAHGCLAKSPNHTPSVQGTIVYLNANPSLEEVVKRVESAGGRVMIEHMNIGEHGHIAYMIDSEGNHVGLHADKY